MATDKVGRLADVLELVLVKSASGLRLSEISGALDSPLSSTHDLLRAMTASGLVRVDAERTYRIGPRFIQLAMSTARSLDVRVLAHEHLEALAADLGHDVYLAVRLGDDVTYVDRIPGRGRATVDIRLGDPVPLHASAAGKLYCAFSPDLESRMLAGGLPALTSRTITSPRAIGKELERVRERGFSISREETITGIVGAAVPVWARPGELLAAVHVSGLRDVLSHADLPDLVASMHRCAESVSRAMGLPAVPGANPRGAAPAAADRAHLQPARARKS